MVEQGAHPLLNRSDGCGIEVRIATQGVVTSGGGGVWFHHIVDTMSQDIVEVLGGYINHAYQGRRIQDLIEMIPSGSKTVRVRTPKRVCRQLDEIQVAKLVAGYASGVRIDDLVQKFQVDQRTVQKHVRQQGLPRRARRVRPAQIAEVIRLYTAGRSVEAMNRTGFPRDSVVCEGTASHAAL